MTTSSTLDQARTEPVDPPVELGDGPVPEWDYVSDFGPDDRWGSAVMDVLRAEGWTSR